MFLVDHNVKTEYLEASEVLDVWVDGDSCKVTEIRNQRYDSFSDHIKDLLLDQVRIATFDLQLLISLGY